ncbi:MAG: NADH-quinone oxidoreductase subunit J [Campylobacterota bacterium]
MYEAIAFYLFSILTISMFLITVLSSNALYSMSSLAAGMIFIAAFFFLLDADFLGAVQIVVYSGAIMAIYAFGMMFFDTLSEVKERNPKKIVFVLSGLIALMMVIIFISPVVASKVEPLYPMIEGMSNPQAVGIVLFTKYLVPFEVAAIMLLVAMIGGIILAGKKMNASVTEMDDEQVQDKGAVE